ncbi:MAG: flagellar filament capping protein FliD [Massilia sp.]
MSISSPGIGSNLDVNGIVAKLMSIEQRPLDLLDQKTSGVQAKLSAMGTITGALSSFQSALASLTSASTFRSVTATASDSTVLSASAGGSAVAGNYKVNVTQLAQAQSLVAAGRTSLTAAIGGGLSTTISFQLGAIGGGSFGINGGALGATVASGGLPGGALSLNGTAIATDASTRSAKALADAVNAKSGTTGVTASAAPTSTSASLFSTFGTVDTTGGGSYTLSVAGVTLATQSGSGAAIDQAAIDSALGGPAVAAALAAAGVTHTGTALGGDLQFQAADGANITVLETVSGPVVQGGIGKGPADANAGSSVTATGTISLASADGSPITVGGTNPAAAGLSAGNGGAYLGASFTQDANQTSGSVVIDSKNNTLQGIRDAINKAGLGVTATIVSDGSAAPNHLVLTSTKTGAHSSMKVTLAGTDGGAPDAALASLLGYDPAGVQNLTQSAAAQSTQLNVNGIAVSSETNTVTEAIQGVTLNVSTTGKTSVTIADDTNAIKTSVSNFVKAYNDLNTAIKGVSGYNAATKTAGPLFGDPTVRGLQNTLRQQFSKGLTGLSGGLTNLSQVGVAFQKDGTLALDSSKLDSAMKTNLRDIAGLFAVVGAASDSLVGFEGSTSATKPGEYALHVTRLATQGTLAGNIPLQSSTTIMAGTKWKVTLDQFSDNVSSSRVATVDLPAGTYTQAQLAAAIQSAINGVSSFAANGSSVSATVANGQLSVASAKYGAQSNIAIESVAGTSPATLFGTAGPSAGVDVAGTIGGEAATGVGQVLTAGAGSAAEGLKVRVNGGSVPADRGTVGFSQGYAYQLNNIATDYVGSDGLLANRKDGLNATITDIGKQRDKLTQRLALVEARYRAQYTALDSAISSMSTTSSYLSQQLARLNSQ